MSKLVLTFDYELFLGEDSGTALKSIIEPTDKILKLLSENGAKAIFFVDATYLLALKKYNSKDFELISTQLKQIVKLGSCVELHLHPQWLDAKPNGARWIFESFEHYRLHSLSKEKIEQLFVDGVETLEEITEQKVKAFRAGGWSITPFEVLEDAFEKSGIVVDMSVCPDFYKKELPMHYYDFRDVPNEEYYRFSKNVNKIDKSGQFLEIPVTTYTMFGIDLAINNILKKLKKDRIFGDGKGLASANVQGNVLKRLFQTNLRRATIEGQSKWFFKKSLKKIGDKGLISFVMHPKTLNKVALNNLEYLVKNYKTLNTEELLKDYF